MSLEKLKQEIESLDAEIKGTEARIKSIVGPGSAAKRKSIERDLADKRPLLLQKKKELAALTKDIAENGPPAEVIPKGWTKVTQAEVNQLQRDGKLAGYDPVKKIALIK